MHLTELLNFLSIFCCLQQARRCPPQDNSFIGVCSALPVAIRLTLRCAPVCAAVHPAYPLPSNGWGVTRPAPFRAGLAARGVAQAVRLHSLHRIAFHFGQPPCGRDSGRDFPA